MHHAAVWQHRSNSNIKIVHNSIDHFLWNPSDFSSDDVLSCLWIVFTNFYVPLQKIVRRVEVLGIGWPQVIGLTQNESVPWKVLPEVFKCSVREIRWCIYVYICMYVYTYTIYIYIYILTYIYIHHLHYGWLSIYLWWPYLNLISLCIVNFVEVTIGTSLSNITSNRRLYVMDSVFFHKARILKKYPQGPISTTSQKTFQVVSHRIILC